MTETTQLPSIIEYSQNLADAEPPKPLPVREYRFVVRGAERAPSKSSGKNNLVLTLWCSPDQYPADYSQDGNPDGETLKIYNSTDDNPMARYRMRLLCEAFGVPLAKRVDASDFMGREVIGNVEHEEYEGRPQARVKGVRAL